MFEASRKSQAAGTPVVARRVLLPPRATASCSAATGGSHFVGVAAVTLPIQRKAAIDTPGDSFEREADDVAERVMRMAEPSSIGASPMAVQRKCAACEDDDQKKIRTQRASDAGVSSARAEVAQRATSRGGVPLPQAVRAYFEPRFGHDFSQVRLHADGEAASAARAIQARAYTLGRHIVFGSGHYAPNTNEGRHLLAHELTHVVQQRGAGMQRGPRSVVQRKDDKKTAPDKEPPKDAPKEKPKKKTDMQNCATDYTIESWEADTCCVNRGFPDPGATSKKAGAECCNTFPRFVDDFAAAHGFDGAASCRKREFLNHRARVTPSGKSPVTVDVLCVDTRASRSAHYIELGFNAAQKAYGSTSVLDKDAKVCISDKEETKTCGLVTDCNDTVKPKESQCLAPECTKSAPAKEKKEAPAK